MTIIWSDDAIASVNNTADYIEAQFGVARSIEFLEDVIHDSNLLKDHPKLGEVDQLLEGARFEYRSLKIGELSRLIYRIDGEVIRIELLWNNRMNPLTLQRIFRA